MSSKRPRRASNPSVLPLNPISGHRSARYPGRQMQDLLSALLRPTGKLEGVSSFCLPSSLCDLEQRGSSLVQTVVPLLPNPGHTMYSTHDARPAAVLLGLSL